MYQGRLIVVESPGTRHLSLALKAIWTVWFFLSELKHGVMDTVFM